MFQNTKSTVTKYKQSNTKLLKPRNEIFKFAVFKFKQNIITNKIFTIKENIKDYGDNKISIVDP